MTPTALAEEIAACESEIARSRRLMGMVPVIVGAVAAVVGFLAFGLGTAAVLAAIGALMGAARPLLTLLAQRRRFARLAVDHPDVFPVALERYRMVMATQRASRYKLFC